MQVQITHIPSTQYLCIHIFIFRIELKTSDLLKMRWAQSGLKAPERSVRDSRQRGLIGAGVPSHAWRDTHLDVNEEPPRLPWTRCLLSVKLMSWITMLLAKVSQSFHTVGGKKKEWIFWNFLSGLPMPSPFFFFSWMETKKTQDGLRVTHLRPGHLLKQVSCPCCFQSTAYMTAHRCPAGWTIDCN